MEEEIGKNSRKGSTFNVAQRRNNGNEIKWELTTLDSMTIPSFFFPQGRTKNRRSNFLRPKKDKSILLNFNLPNDSKMPGASRANQFH